jgi:hypothetical protein
LAEEQSSGDKRRDAGGIVDEGLKAPKKQSTKSGHIRPGAGGLVPDATGMMSEDRRPGDITTFGTEIICYMLISYNILYNGVLCFQ